MAADVGQAYCGWAPELPEQQEPQELSVSNDDFSSFGSFKFDSLDWEKRSVFTRNRCQEELEKFKTPGLVARKKAFFEERYKKIRAQKAMEENQQLILDDGSACSISNRVKNETSVHIESTGDGASNVDVHSEETSFQVTLHKKQRCEDMQIQNTSSILHSSTGGWLDDGSARRISNRVNETSVRIESDGDVASNVDVHSEETSFQVTLYKKQSGEDMQIQNTSSTIHSSTGGWLDVIKETTDDCSLHLQGLDSKFLMLESLKTEVIEHHSHLYIDDRGGLREPDNSELTSQLEKNSSCSEVEIHHRDTQVTGRPSLVQAELVEESQFSGHDDMDTSMKNYVLESNDDLATAGTMNHHANSDAVKPDHKDISLNNCILDSNVDLVTAVTVVHNVNSDCSIAQEKAKSHVRKQKGNAAVTKLMKGPVSSARYLLKVDFKSQTITSQPPKHHSQQLVGKAKNTLESSNAASDKVSRNIRSSPVTSHKPLTGACSKATIPVPVSFGTERRTRDNALKLQGPARGAARTCSVNNGESEDKISSEQIPEKRPTSRRGRVANLAEPLKDQKSNELENKRGSGQVKERRPISCRGRVTNSSELMNQKSKGSENKGGSDEVRERRPTSCSGRPINIKDQKSEGTVNQRGSEQVRGKTVPTAPMVRVAYIREPLKDQKSRTSENKRGSEQVRERILPGGPMLRAVNVPVPPKEKRSKVSENLRGSEQVRERALPNVSDSPNAKISRSVNLPAQNQSNPHGGVYRSTVAVRKNEPNEVASSRADLFSHKGKRPQSGSRSQNGTLPRQEMRPWR